MAIPNDYYGGTITVGSNRGNESYAEGYALRTPEASDYSWSIVTQENCKHPQVEAFFGYADKSYDSACCPDCNCTITREMFNFFKEPIDSSFSLPDEI